MGERVPVIDHALEAHVALQMHVGLQCWISGTLWLEAHAQWKL
jgi:hypothetical protein